MSSKKKLIFSVISIFLVFTIGLLLAFTLKNSQGNGSNVKFQKGVCYATWNPKAYSSNKSAKSLEALAELGTEYVGLVTTWYQQSFDSSQIKALKTKTPTDKSLVDVIKKIHSLGMKVTLKLHLDFIKSNGRWRAEIDFPVDDSWDKWFESYSNYVLHYAKMAKDLGVEIICIGTELTNCTLTKPDKWRELIRRVRSVYNGQLTYAANWHEEYAGIEFWDMLDFVGIDAYFPLADANSPSFEELKKNWGDWVTLLERWYEEENINKPIVFMEVGYKSSCEGAICPWEHMPEGPVDLKLQEASYRALFETFWDKPYFFGTYWWYWGTAVKMGGPYNRGFSFQNKPAQDIVKEWYSKPVSKKFQPTKK